MKTKLHGPWIPHYESYKDVRDLVPTKAILIVNFTLVAGLENKFLINRVIFIEKVLN